MTVIHRLVVAGATIVALALLVGMVAGVDLSLGKWGAYRSVRDVSIALWAFLLPAWFTLEEAWFAPDSSVPEKVAWFQKRQTRGRITWTIAAGAVAIIIGSTSPVTPKSATAPPQEAQR